MNAKLALPSPAAMGYQKYVNFIQMNSPGCCCLPHCKVLPMEHRQLGEF